MPLTLWLPAPSASRFRKTVTGPFHDLAPADACCPGQPFPSTCPRFPLTDAANAASASRARGRASAQGVRDRP
jgi:hypothetical protein